MKLNQSVFKDQAWTFLSETPGFIADNAQLVLAFGERFLLEKLNLYDQLRARYPTADIVINSTSGEIYLDKVHDGSVIVTAIEQCPDVVFVIILPIPIGILASPSGIDRADRHRARHNKKRPKPVVRTWGRSRGVGQKWQFMGGN